MEIGISLIGIFETPTPAMQEAFGESTVLETLGVSGAPAYNTIGNNVGSLSNFDLNLYSSGNGDNQPFSTGSAAFTGSTTTDFFQDDFAPYFPNLQPLGSTGNIIVGDSISGSGAVIGEWQIIPEPASASLALLGAAALGLRRRRQR